MGESRETAYRGVRGQMTRAASDNGARKHRLQTQPTRAPAPLRREVAGDVEDEIGRVAARRDVGRAQGAGRAQGVLDFLLSADWAVQVPEVGACRVFGLLLSLVADRFPPDTPAQALGVSRSQGSSPEAASGQIRVHHRALFTRR